MRSKIGKEQVPPRRNVFILIIIGVYLFLSLLMFDPKLFTGGDNAVYVILAESISRGKGYKDLYLPDPQPHTQYPFGFPLLLAPFVLIFGVNVILLKFVVLLSGVGALYFMIKICESLFKNKLYLLIASYVSLPIMITYNHWILSEMPFACFSLAAVYLLMKAERSAEHFYYFAFLCSIFAVFIRTAGIALIIGIVLWLVLSKRYKQLVIFLVLFLLLFIPWQMRTAGIEKGGGYIEQLLAKNPYQMELGSISVMDFIRRIWENFTYYAFKILPSTLMPFVKADVILGMTGLLFAVLAIIGFITRIKRCTVFEMYFIFAIIILLAWPKVWSSDRFLLPVLPIFVIYIYGGLFWIEAKLKARYLVEVVAGVIIFFNILGIATIVRQNVAWNVEYIEGDRYAGYSLDWRRYFELVEWARIHVPTDKVIMARKPEFVYLLSRHKSFIYPFTTDREQVREAIKKCDYIILDNFYWTATSSNYLLPVLRETPEKYRIMKKTAGPEFYLLRVATDS
jgi:hypothetical protein